jgi:peptidoglycan/LPS O-acetylase OafA/YrhL
MFLGKEKPYFKMLFSKLKNIILPYTFWYIIYYIFYMVAFDYPSDNISFILKHFVAGSLAPHTYFVPLIMQFFILYPLWKFMLKKVKPYIAIPLAIIISVCAENFVPGFLHSLGINFIYNDRMFTTYLSYWVVGCYIGANYNNFKILINKIKLYIPFIVVALINICFSYLHFNIKPIPHLNIVHSLYCFAAVFFLFYIFANKSTDLKCKLLKTIDNTSYTIYLCHMLFVFTAEFIFSSTLCIQSNLLLFVLMALFVYPLSVTTAYIVKRLQN